MQFGMGKKVGTGVAILARGMDITENRRGLPGNEDDTNSRYIEAFVNDIIICCLYLPNGNPAPGPKFDYKLEWFNRFNKYTKKLIASNDSVILTGDFNVIPTELDVYKPERWVNDALFRPESRNAFKKINGSGVDRCFKKTSS